MSEEERSAELAKLRRFVITAAGGLALLIGAAAVGMVVSIDEPRTDDMRKLAMIAALAGLVGGATRSLLEMAESVGGGFELSDGTRVLRGRAAALHGRDMRDWERRREAHDRRHSGESDPEPFNAPRPQPDAAHTLSVSDIPGIVVSPLVGAVLGVVVFAGVVGGFLVASTDAGDYSPAALMFIAFLGGVFSAKFLERLSAASDALFGTEDRSRQKPQQHSGQESEGAQLRQE